MEYLNFDLQVGIQQDGRYPVSVLHSPAGEALDMMVFPYTRDRLELRLKDLKIALLSSANIARQVLPPELQSVRDMGIDFFNALFTGEIRSSYDLSQRIAMEQGKGLRLRLRIQPAELSALPWEYLYDPRNCEYLCLSSSTPLIRYLEVQQAVRPIKVMAPLRVLGMVCSPSNLDALDVEQEKRRVEEALANLREHGQVELVWLKGETCNDLQDALLEGPWHVFHFIGHGDFDYERDEGYLMLTSENGKAHRLHATEFARLLADHREMRVVVLNACQGARSSWESVFSSTAAVLVRRGIACAVAMQFSITDTASIELARRFYATLARGLPVDMALTEARKAISVNFQNSVEWGTPVLFMRSPDGVLFRMDIGKTSQRKPSGIKSPPARITQNQSAEIRETLKSSPATDSSTNKAFSPAKLPESSIAPQTLPVEQNQTPTSSPAMTGKDMPGQDAVQNSRPIPQISPADEEPATKPQARKLSPGLYITFLRLILISLAVLLVLLAGKYSWIYLSEQMLKTGSTKVWPKDGMVTVYVPKGEFLMGSTEEQVSPFMDECPNCIYRNEQPQHTIYLDAFWIDKTEVTNKQYAECVNKSGCPLPLKTQSGTHNFYYNNSAYENYPVIYVSWNDAKKYCSWAGRRLPSEAEWEKAARGVDGRIYPWGNQEPDCTLANYRSTIETYCVGDTTSVGSYPNGGSVYGALDMVGNVWEWVNDTYDPGYYSVSPKNNPIGPTETPELMTLGLRGGGWPIISVNLRTANRNYGEPDYSHNSVGFRCAASP